MDIVEGYDRASSSEDEADKAHKAIQAEVQLKRRLNDTEMILMPDKSKFRKVEPADVLATTSPEEAELMLPIQGPLQPHQQGPGGLYRQYRNYEMGHLLPLDKSSAVSLADAYTEALNATRSKADFKPPSVREEEVASKVGFKLQPLSKERVHKNDPESEDFLGPWAPYKGEEERRSQLKEISKVLNETAADVTESLSNEASKSRAPTKAAAKPNPPSVQFHVSDLTDYLGRSWVEASNATVSKAVLDSTLERTYALPKKVVHTFRGHTKGINRIRWFPKTAHLLLSGSMDATVKIWGVEEENRLIATYKGHTKAVKDINFTCDGRHFYSAGFDCLINYTDTEYGKVVNSFGNEKLPFCCTVHPDPGMQHVVICASQNKKAIQYDSRTGEIVQEYNEHLAAVNTVTFCENGKKLVTTSDDKKMFVWEFGIGVVVKHIAEPYMHAMPAVQLDPTGQYLACQSMDNQIVVYEGTGRFRFQSRRRFKGHQSTGYAILPGFSPNGAFLTSGDSGGRCWIWDWKSSKVHRSSMAHDGVCMGAIWHPHKQSMIATSGWDGLIKLWE
eukprot:Blabericola_migrator_1__804@NODE_11_length_24785_cov_110_100736_g8_i0_p5_GENE_NODE_11_length_24785_cov_110_100736_g8_i0NODE_11_length_24785_cov_110_100736_g8_i0_p5_ORF_typecomplete_len560_score88_75WD40/PF00400_32/9_4e09WD40/PF00400_32/0_00056WD40/PF00400_32/5_5e03WD40/PF00400_32/0_0002WD40/PF00400_32/6_7WD40/PF00400_32/0_044WD40/PF00400_32/0_036ANAPC4_WD40/PF12894_7/6_9e06ANAPC4_WD40/PF12894_7/7_5e06ANAPC4_WD40/PF12894_7/0_0016ANAPC4_WD40/PF12894_7/3_1e07ANAPC4_WD40/PF12894_7/58eIF2A/PF08662_11